VVSFTPRPLYPQGKRPPPPVPIGCEAWWAPEAVWSRCLVRAKYIKIPHRTMFISSSIIFVFKTVVFFCFVVVTVMNLKKNSRLGSLYNDSVHRLGVLLHHWIVHIIIFLRHSVASWREREETREYYIQIERPPHYSYIIFLRTTIAGCGGKWIE
jgi:hypothetical protein